MQLKQVVVIAGPSGSGKNAVIDEIIKICPRCERLVTATTRAPRVGEINGVDYHFLKRDEFDRALASGDILEHRYVSSLDTHYGVYKPDLESRLTLGQVVFAHLDIIGARYLKEHYNATTIFIMPDSLEILESRVRGRNHDMPEEEVQKRMAIARTEVTEHAPKYDYRVLNINGKLDQTIAQVVEILKKEGYDLSP
ncbi:guanylate kinase [Candidatus Kaiserbacteria bacterium]|nr:guanylate kinase [Candidatus Kaiserbacteria bacterium]